MIDYLKFMLGEAIEQIIRQDDLTKQSIIWRLYKKKIFSKQLEKLINNI